MIEKNLTSSYSTFNLQKRQIRSFNMNLFWSKFIIFILLAFTTSIESQSFKISKSNGFPLFSLMNTPFYDNSEHAVFQIQLNFTKIHDSSIALISDIRKEIVLIAKKPNQLKTSSVQREIWIIQRELKILWLLCIKKLQTWKKWIGEISLVPF